MRSYDRADVTPVVPCRCGRALHRVAVGASRVRAQDLPRGVVIDDVKCADDPAQSYALYLPSAYRPDRVWNLLIGFHPGARGRAIVETYQAAAEQYGYIVAGSNTSRNGPWAISMASVRAMSARSRAAFRG